ncbi:MAG: cobalt-precorrin-6A/precorrin-6x reductase, partial [Sulfitobacter sp.]|nr:cobalt-precorrin-6A/precorrin-6x reductase [Sulfitobacter sp.]
FPGERLFLRQTTPHDRVSPYEYVELIFGQPPFTVETETALFRELAIDMLICRNLGGNPSRPKLDAARALGMGVILIDRPPLPAGVRQVAEVRDALAWVDAL